VGDRMIKIVNQIIKTSVSMLLIVLLISCNSDYEKDFEVHMTVKHNESEEVNNPYKRIYEYHQINTYEEYLSYLRTSNIESDDYDQTFFESNTLVIIPVLSNKDSEFTLSSFTREENMISFNITQNIGFVRDFVSSYYDDYYVLEITINNKEINEISYYIQEEHKEYQSQMMILSDIDEVFSDKDYVIIKSSSELESVIAKLDFHPNDSKEDLLSIYEDNSYESHHLYLIFTKTQVGNYTRVEDIYMNDWLSFASLEIYISEYGNSSSLQEWYVLTIVQLDVSSINQDDVHVNIHD
jgi:hypothetical protein